MSNHLLRSPRSSTTAGATSATSSGRASPLLPRSPSGHTSNNGNNSTSNPAASSDDDTFDEAAFVKARAIERLREAAALRVGRDAISSLGAAIAHTITARAAADPAAAAAAASVGATTSASAAAAAAVAGSNAALGAADAHRQRELEEDSIFNRSSRLSSLLAKRSTREQLYSNNILRGGAGRVPGAPPVAASLIASQESLVREQRRNRLASLLASRSDAATLASARILLTHEEAYATHDSHVRSRASLGALLAERPSREALYARQLLSPAAVDLELDLAVMAGHTGAGNNNNNSCTSGTAVSAAPVSAAAAAAAAAASAAAASAASAMFQPSMRLVPLSESSNGNGGVVGVSCGWGHTLLQHADGSVTAFGTPANGRLGLSGAEVDAALAASLAAATTAVDATAADTAAAGIDKETIAAMVRAAANDVMVPAPVGAFSASASAAASASSDATAVVGPVKCVVSGDAHSAAISAKDGALYTWGTGVWGRLGLGLADQADTAAPTKVTLLVPPPSAAAAGDASKAAAAAASASSEDLPPQWVESPAVCVSAGAAHTLVLTASGHVLAFGWNKNGRLGVSPADVTAAAHARALHDALAAAVAESAASDGGLMSPGSPASATAAAMAGAVAAAALQPASALSITIPVVVAALPPSLALVGVAAGEAASAAWDANGNVWLWGAGMKPLTSSTAVADAAALAAAAAAIKPAAAAAAAPAAAPVAVAAAPVAAATAQLSPTLGKRSSGSLRQLAAERAAGGLGGGLGASLHSAAAPAASGVAGSGGAGAGSFARSGTVGVGSQDVLVPVRAAALARWRVSALSLATYHGAALTHDGRVLTWGSDKDGQLARAPQGNTAAGTVLSAAVTSTGFNPPAEVSLGEAAVYAGDAAASVLASKSATVVVTRRGQLLAAGKSGRGLLGLSAAPGCGDRVCALTAVPLPADAAARGRIWRAAAASWGHIVGCDDEGSVYTAGTAAQGKLGYFVLNAKAGGVVAN